MKFDIVTLVNRIVRLGGDIYDIICHPEFPEDYQQVFYYEDTRHQKHEDKGDYFVASTFTQFMDQLLMFASIRKGLGKRESMALGAVARDELKNDKISYDNDGDIKTLPYNNFEKFVEYSLKDTLLLKLLEDKNKDLDLLFMIGEMTATRMKKAMKKTISIKNMAHIFYKQQGYIMGNNRNTSYDYDSKPEDDGEKFTGAYVADPMKMSFVGKIINGLKSMFVFDNVIDFDLTALYPSIIRAFNIDSSTQWGRFKFEGKEITKDYDPGGEFIDHLETKHWSEIGSRYLNLPDTNQLLDDLKEEGIVA